MPRKVDTRCDAEVPDEPGLLCARKEKDHDPPHRRGRIRWWNGGIWRGQQ